MDIEVERAAVHGARQALPDVVERSASAIVDVGSTALAESFSRFLAEIGEMVESVPETVGSFVVDEMELAVSIGATGSFRIASSTANASLKVVLRRPSDSSEAGRPDP